MWLLLTLLLSVPMLLLTLLLGVPMLLLLVRR
jgi:hypothetical protein